MLVECNYYSCHKKAKAEDEIFCEEHLHVAEEDDCPFCGSKMEWCGVCDTYTSTCCETWGTCMCS